MKTATLAALCVAFFSVNAEARQRHKTTLHPRCNIDWPCAPVTASTPDQDRVARGRYIARQMGFGSAIERPVRKPRVAKVDYKHVIRTKPVRKVGPVRTVAPEPSAGYSIARPSRYIPGRLICAVNVGVALAERGIQGTGSALARSYLRWGRSAGGPVPGAVIVSPRGRRGGHVAIVSRVENGVVYAWNATGGQSGWREIPYRHHVIDYRVPG